MTLLLCLYYMYSPKPAGCDLLKKRNKTVCILAGSYFRLGKLSRPAFHPLRPNCAVNIVSTPFGEIFFDVATTIVVEAERVMGR